MALSPAHPIAAHRSVKPGEIVTLGTYPQAADGADRRPIQWRVLQNTGGELFVLSEYILDCRRYYGEFADTCWRDCDLRKWLNGEFYKAAFTAGEKTWIKTIRCMGNGEGSPETRDKVFLLSVDEVKSLTSAQGEDGLDRRARGTEFARVRKADGCRLYVYDKTVEADYITEKGTRYGCSWWWLRTQPKAPSRAAFVGMRGSVRGYARVSRVGYGVRPALKIEIS